MARLRIRPRAEVDLEEHYVRIGRDNPRAAGRFREGMQHAFDFLAEYPLSGALWESGPIELHGLRLWTTQRYRNYVIIYRALEKGAEVLRVVYGARDLLNLAIPDD